MRFVIAFALITAVAVSWLVARKFIPADIEYRGEKIKLSKYYFDYEEYKDDSDNIAIPETERVQKLVRTAPMPPHYASADAVMKAVSEVTFPGYGSGGFGEIALAQNPALVGFCVEVPRADEERCFTFEKDTQGYRLADDFLLKGGLLRTVRRDEAELTYVRFDGTSFKRTTH